MQSLSAALADRYRIERELGQGGMATVYLAHDVKHDRKVALKVLRPELAAILGGERFLKEIRTTANLQHPHILALFDSGTVGQGDSGTGLVYYVMPYVDGESLRDRLAREKQLPVDDAVRIAREVADALQYAHEHGIVHRDIKPENILLHGGHAMVADFGIALAASRSEGSTRMTETGMSLGTPHYMAPEQAMGEREITPKADVYALGCVTYEMLTGEPPFNGPTAQAIIARVMTEEPRGMTIQRKTIPPHVEEAVFNALAKLPADRYATAAEFAAALADGQTGRRPGGAIATRTTARAGSATALPPFRRTAVLAGALALVAAAFFLGRRGRGAGDAMVAAQIIPDNGHRLGSSYASNLAISPDGRTLVYIGTGPSGQQLYRRALDGFDAMPISGTEDVFSDPVFSPDGRSLAYVSGDNSIRRVALSGGQPQQVVPATSCCVLQWSPEGIYYSSIPGLELVGEAGGAPRLVAPLGPPGVAFVLPSGNVVEMSIAGRRHVEFFKAGAEHGTVVTGLPDNISDLEYHDGYLLLSVGTALMAVKFDEKRGRVLGDPVTVIPNIRVGASGGFTESQLAVGPSTIAWVPANGSNRLTLVDRAGHETVLPDTSGVFHRPQFSPDGRMLSFDVTRASGRDVWVYDFEQRTMSRVTFQPNGHDAIWTPDGRALYYAAALNDTMFGLFRRRIDGSAELDTISAEHHLDAPQALTADGKDLLSYAITPTLATDAWLVPVNGGPHRVLLGSNFDESGLGLSPDRRWLAYVSDESGRREVYVRPLEGGSRIQVSTAGGREPLWDPNGRDLYYRVNGGSGAVLAMATLSLSPLHVTARSNLFPIPDYEEAQPHGNYDISPRGDRFIFVRQQMPNEIRVLTNWKAMLNRR